MVSKITCKIFLLNLFKKNIKLFNLWYKTTKKRYFKRKISILFEFIPQIIFITLIFVYLCLMIIIKWVKYAGNDDPEYGSCAPNLLLGKKLLNTDKNV